MKWFIDGDHVVMTRDDFVDLQESPAVFVSRNSDIGKTVRATGIQSLPTGILAKIRLLLAADEGSGEDLCPSCQGELDVTAADDEES